jgi:hypothetical protein
VRGLRERRMRQLRQPGMLGWNAGSGLWGGTVRNRAVRTSRCDHLTEQKAAPSRRRCFPNAYQRIGESNQGESPLREGAFLVARGRVAQEEATGSKLVVDNVVLLGGKASQLSALTVAIQEQQPEEWSALGA